MTKQSKQIYSSLIGRIAWVMMINQALILVLGTLNSTLESILVARFGDTAVIDFIFRMSECVVYFLCFVLPLILFNKMNKNAEQEIYEPVEGERATPLNSVFLMGIGLGLTNMAIYVNYYVVNALWDYSDFSQEELWAVELDHPYQVVIYFISVAIIPPVVEELLFRGAICKSLKIYGKTTAVVISALLFSLMHTNAEQFIYTFVAGLFLGLVYVETRNILFPILLHFLNNSIAALEQIVYETVSPMEYSKLSNTFDIFIWVFMAISLVGFLLSILKKGSFIRPISMKPDENGESVAPLSASEKVAGFFNVKMVLFIAYSFAVMAYFIYLSTQK